MPTPHKHRPQHLALAIALALSYAEFTLAEADPNAVETPDELIATLDSFINDANTVKTAIKEKKVDALHLGEQDDLVSIVSRGSFTGVLVDGGDGQNILQLDAKRGGVLEETRNFVGLEVKQGAWTHKGPADFLSGALVRADASLTNEGHIIGRALTQGTLTNTGTIAGSASVLPGGNLTNQGLVAGTVDVHENAHFAGPGVIGALNVQGHVSVNREQGAPVIVGNLNLHPSAVLAYEVDASGNSETLSVQGTASLGDATLKLVTAGDYPHSSQHTLLKAGKVEGTFGKIDNQLAFMDPSLQYEEQRVGLTYTRNDVPLEKAADSDNSRELAKSLQEPQDTLPSSPPPQQPVEPQQAQAPKPTLQPQHTQAPRPTPEPGHTPASNPAPKPDSAYQLLGALLTSNKATAALAFEQLAAESNANLAKATLGSVSPVNTAMLSAMRQLNTPQGLSTVNKGPRQAAGSDTGRVWLQALGHGGKVDRDFPSTLQHTTQGLVMGVDWRVDDQWRMGVMGGKSQTDFDAKWLDGNLDSWHLGAYAVHQSGPIALRLGATVANHDAGSKRQVAFNGFRDTPKGNYNASTQHAFAEVGFNLGTHNVTFEPFANLGYQRYHRDNFTEKGGAAALKVYGQTQDNLSSTFGLRMARLNTLDNGLQLTPRMSASWTRTYGDLDSNTRQRLAMGGDRFEIQGADLDRRSLSLDLGLDLGLSASHTLGLGVTGEIGTDSRSHGVMGQWRMAF